MILLLQNRETLYSVVWYRAGKQVTFTYIKIVFLPSPPSSVFACYWSKSLNALCPWHVDEAQIHRQAYSRT